MPPLSSNYPATTNRDRHRVVGGELGDHRVAALVLGVVQRPDAAEDLDRALRRARHGAAACTDACKCRRDRLRDAC